MKQLFNLKQLLKETIIQPKCCNGGDGSNGQVKASELKVLSSDPDREPFKKMELTLTVTYDWRQYIK